MTCIINKAHPSCRAGTLAPALTIALLALTLSGAPSIAHADDVYWTTKDLLKDFFKSSERVTYVKVEGVQRKRELMSLLGYTPQKDSYVVFVAKTGEMVDGYAVIDEEMGQHLPITFGVKIGKDGQVERLEVMIYREGYGDEIREKRFRVSSKARPRWTTSASAATSSRSPAPRSPPRRWRSACGARSRW
jgi:hypothetical protein